MNSTKLNSEHKKYKLLVSSYHMNQVLDSYSELLGRHGITVDTIIRNPVVREDDLLPIIDQYDAVICSDDEYTSKVLSRAENLKVISKWGTGIDSIDVQFAEQKGVKVFSSPGAFSESAALLVWGMILTLARKIIIVDARVKAGSWDKVPGISLSNKTLGVIGLGHIGKQVIKSGIGFGMNLLGHDIQTIDSSFIRQHSITLVNKDSLVRNSDIIVVCVDLNPTSHHLLAENEFSIMSSTSMLINVSRGPVISEKALEEALANGQLAGAGLDVFEEEPLPNDSTLRAMENCVLSSHNAYNTTESVTHVHENTINNILIGLNCVPKTQV